MNTTTKVLGGFLIGTAIGIATGLLVAPSSGTKTRKKIMRKSRVYSQQAIDAVRQYLDGLKKNKKGEWTEEQRRSIEVE